LPFPSTAENRAIEVLGRVHSDIFGPQSPPSLVGSRYILTFIDDFSRYSKVYFLEQKSQTFEKFQEYKAYVEKQTSKTLKILRSDNGGEYINHEMLTFIRAEGIRHETTTSDTPEQNGVAERYNRTLLETMRSIMHAGGIPEKLWAEIADTAAYIQNRVFTSSNQNKMPYEL